MNSIAFENKNSLVRTSDLDKTRKKLSLELTKIKESASRKEFGYEAINVPADTKTISNIVNFAKQKQLQNPQAIFVIGIGGSNLGAMAIYEAIKGKFANDKANTKLYFADTTDSDSINELRIIEEQILQSGKNIILNLISKSGKTTESIANFEVLLEVLRKYKPDYYKYVVVTTDKNSLLEEIARKEKFDVLHISQTVGGRYSVFTPVGLFPLAMTGIDVKKLIKGANSATNRCLAKEFGRNPAAQCAVDLFCNYKEGKSIHDLFIFSNDLESTGKWYRQLLAESLGKKYSKSGAIVHEGITPTVSIGSTDLHSMAQLYLGGPDDKFTTFVHVPPKNKLKIPKMKEYSRLVEGIQGKKMSDIMDAIYRGVKLAYIKEKKPFNIYEIEKNEYSLGQFMQTEMIKTIMLSHLLNVNCFDQPAVEEYKQETRSILKKNA